MKNRVGFYFDASHLKNFSIDKYESGLLGISGTDSSLLRVVKMLSKRNQFEVFFFGKNLDEFEGVNFVKVKSFEEAIYLAKEKLNSLLVFNLKKTEEIIKGISISEKINFNLVAWAQNPIESNFLNQLDKSKAILKIIFVEAYELNHIRHKKAFYKGVVIPNGIEKEIYTNKEIILPDNLNVFYLGALTPSKGFHYIARAWPEVLKKVPNARLLIIGSGKLYNNHAKLGSLGIADEEYEKLFTPYIGKNADELEKNNVSCLGLLNRNEIIEVIYNSKVGCMNPSTVGSLESCSVTSLEIQLCGVPVIAGKAGGNLNTIINNKTGILIRNQNKELPEAIVKLLSEDTLNLKMRIAAREYILKKYEIEVVVNQWSEFLNKLIKGDKFPLPGIPHELFGARLFAKEVIRLLKR